LGGRLTDVVLAKEQRGASRSLTAFELRTALWAARSEGYELAGTSPQNGLPGSAPGRTAELSRQPLSKGRFGVGLGRDRLEWRGLALRRVALSLKLRGWVSLFADRGLLWRLAAVLDGTGRRLRCRFQKIVGMGVLCLDDILKDIFSSGEVHIGFI